ncbi:poly-gamma-glutamate synthesis protein (capsule biosynthesis protein) [Oryzomicrobium terrae]|uniref:Poly-gamma-glutamate synthesis protein (Capsule biosynthesis protein) n=1 Tax=Oryzomicrobium terrae TaxID=1735038 RepID=A0A5C1EBH5_9RHOO|nr:CapA family protein [Oryzomicrobium terrae]QEL65939.1 poly-gamma-glutamate synthesis protein (capsule biosynthesis protein) [Oryzomicrobium terrae]
MRIALMGDIMLGRGVARALKGQDGAALWGDLLPWLATADLRFANLECAITRHRRPWSRYGKRFHFRAAPDVLDVLRAGGVDVVSLANNHTLDFEARGLRDTLAHLDWAGIAHAGAGRNLGEAAAPAWLDAGGKRVAVIAVTDNEPGFAATATAAGTHYLPVDLSPAADAALAALLASPRRAGADLVIFSNHWGPNFVERPPPAFRQFARRVIDLGADLYVGHSAHLTQGVELYRGKPILYDCGDFIDDYAVDPVLRNDWSCLFLVDLDDSGQCTRLALIPVCLALARVRRATGAEAEAICRRQMRLSAELGTTLLVRDGVLCWTSSPAQGASGCAG